ncbi:MAG: hypothetical protein E6Q40_13980 [Cupriavidus sp.]|nr:MAG: hypothetical protein E6Q40_13980 [Cupriavidus sp.]
MPYYNEAKYLHHETGVAYNTILGPGSETPNSGIYRCEGCGASAVSTKGNPLPPQNHHQHNATQGHVRWRLVVRTTHV